MFQAAVHNYINARSTLLSGSNAEKRNAKISFDGLLRKVLKLILVKALEKDNHPGVKRVLNLTTITRGTLDIWDGTNVDDLRQLALDFAGTKLKVCIVLKNDRKFGKLLLLRTWYTSNR